MPLTAEEAKAIHLELIDMAIQIGRIQGRRERCKDCMELNIQRLQCPVHQ